MWDVVWTDAGRELVGEHRARKQQHDDEEKEKRRKNGDDGNDEQTRSSLSTASSRSSAESAFARFRSRGLRHINTSKANARMAAASPATTSSSGPASSSMRSPLSRASDAKSRRSSSLSAADSPGTEETGASAELAREDRDPVASANGTIPPPHPTAGSASTASTKGPARGQLEASPSPMARRPVFDLQSPAREAFTIPNRRSGEPSTPPQSPTRGALYWSAEQPASPVRPALPTKSPLRARKPGSAASPRAAMAEGPAEEPAAASTARSRNSAWKPVDLETLTQEVDAMGSASPATALSRLKEIGAAAADDGRLETEKMRWMLSTLHHLDLAAPHDASRPPTGKIEAAKVHSILALYESKASALYLAGLHPTKRICHLSDAPLPHDTAPNVQPLCVAAVSASTFPIPPQLFEAAYALSLPALCAADDLRGILHSVSRCLKPGGALHLVVVDPLPCAHTLGARLGAWLEQHLLANLRARARCTAPSALLPRWLGEAALRGAGSTRTAAKFYASSDSVVRRGQGQQGQQQQQQQRDRDPDPAVERLRAERETRAELRSVVGRMLWREVWGEFVTAGGWWWDDAACVAECLELGTFWEYHLVEAVREAQ